MFEENNFEKRNTKQALLSSLLDYFKIHKNTKKKPILIFLLVMGIITLTPSK